MGLAHSGLTTGGRFSEYADTTSIMSSRIVGPDRVRGETGAGREWRGYNPPQLWRMGWLQPSRVQDADMRTSRQYTLKSLSSNDRSGPLALRLVLPGGVYWVSWRDAINQDVDLGSRQMRDDARPLSFTGTLMVHHERPSQETERDGIVVSRQPVVLGGGTVTISAVGRGVVQVQVAGSSSATSSAARGQQTAAVTTAAAVRTRRTRRTRPQRTRRPHRAN